MPRIDVIDLFHGDRDPQFHAIKTAGVQAVMLKASNGASVRDGALRPWAARCQALDLPIGAYHFMTRERAEEQLENFLGAIKGLGEVVPALDFEPWQGVTPDPQILVAMASAMAEKFGRLPMLYGSYQLTSLGNNVGASLAHCPLWLARYGHEPVMPTWSQAELALWQWAPAERIEGLTDFGHKIGGYGPYDVNEWRSSLSVSEFWRQFGVSA